MAFRFIFESDGDRVRLVRKMRVDMVAPEQPVDTTQSAAGVYAELRNVDEETLYRANLSAQIQPTREVFSPDGRAERVATEGARKRVAVVVAPDPEDAASVVVVRRRAAEEGRGIQGMDAGADEEELERASLDDVEEPQ